MGNANALIQSDDWAALINDAKARNCYMDMESVPKEFLVLKGPSPNTPNKPSFPPRGLRSSGSRQRLMDVHVESRSSVPLEDGDKFGASLFPRNGLRPLKSPMENSTENLDHMCDRSREAWQYGVPKRQSSGPMGKRDY